MRACGNGPFERPDLGRKSAHTYHPHPSLHTPPWRRTVGRVPLRPLNLNADLRVSKRSLFCSEWKVPVCGQLGSAQAEEMGSRLCRRSPEGGEAGRGAAGEGKLTSFPSHILNAS